VGRRFGLQRSAAALVCGGRSSLWFAAAGRRFGLQWQATALVCGGRPPLWLAAAGRRFGLRWQATALACGGRSPLWFVAREKRRYSAAIQRRGVVHRRPAQIAERRIGEGDYRATIMGR